MLTALRTAATSAMVAKYLAPEGSTTMAMIGNGAQSEFQSLAMKAICGVDTIRLYDKDMAASRKCAANLEGTGLKTVICATPEEAIEGAQILTTCTADKQYATILSDNMVGAGVHINAIGGDCPGKTELAKGILERSDVFVEYPPQTRIEGEIQQMDEDFAVTEFWQVVTGAKQGRTSARQITLFDSVGFAIEDFSALRYIRDKVKDTDFHYDLDQLADPDDPRDLFGMLQRAKCPTSARAPGQPCVERQAECEVEGKGDAQGGREVDPRFGLGQGDAHGGGHGNV
jgi:ornithine cyclodeaminase